VLVLGLKSIITKIKTSAKNLHFNKYILEAVLKLKESMTAIVDNVQYFKNFQTETRSISGFKCYRRRGSCSVRAVKKN